MHALSWLVAVMLSDVAVPFAPDVRRPPEWLTPSLVLSGSVLGVTEVLSSERCIWHGSCVEANPMMPGGRGNGDAAARLLIKTVGTAAVAYLLLKHRHRHPWATVIAHRARRVERVPDQPRARARPAAREALDGASSQGSCGESSRCVNGRSGGLPRASYRVSAGEVDSIVR